MRYTGVLILFILGIVPGLTAQPVGVATVDPGYVVERLGSGLDSADVYALFVHANTLYAAAGTAGIYRLNLEEGLQSEWEYVGLSGVECREIAVNPNSPDVLLAGTISHGAEQHSVYRSTDGGATWTGADEGIEGPKLYTRTLPAKSKIRFHPTDPDRISITQIGALTPHYSTDGGRTWAPYATPELQSGSINDVSWDPEVPGTMYAGGEGLGLSALLMKSTDDGQTWTQKLTHETLDEIGGESAVDVITFSPYDPDIIVLGTEGYFIRSTDRGETWSAVLQERTLHYQTAVSWDLQRHDLIFSSGGGFNERSRGGLYISDDNGVSWRQVADAEWCTIESGVTVAQVPGGGVFSAARNRFSDPADSLLHGVFVLRPKESSVYLREGETAAPSLSYRGEGRFTINGPEKVTGEGCSVVLYDMLGRRQRLLEFSPGTSAVVLPAPVPGAYVYRLMVGRDVRETGTLLVQ